LRFADYFLGVLRINGQNGAAGPAKDAQHLPTEAQRTFPELVRIAKMKAQTLGTRPATLRTSVTKPATDRAEISIKKILAPTDFSPPSRKALHYALRFAEEFGSEVILLHVLEPVMPLTFEGLTNAIACGGNRVIGCGKKFESASRVGARAGNCRCKSDISARVRLARNRGGGEGPRCRSYPDRDAR
jgi:hypothetical protein